MIHSKIYLSTPHMSGKEQKYIQEAFDTNWVAPLGPNVTGFEQDIEKYIGENAFVGALSSGTAAIHLALVLLGVKAGDEVLCQSMTFAASANPILYQGAFPVFIDSEKDTWNICPIALEEAIIDRMAKNKKIKAIITVDLYGMPYKVDEVHAIAEKYRIPILEDSSEALGSSYKGKKCGTFGTISSLSFNGNKIITTSCGGAIVTKTKELRDKAVFFATQSRDNAPYFQHSEIGYNYRMSNICAGIGRGQMEVLDNHVELRRTRNAWYRDFFKSIAGVTVFKEPSADYFSNHWLTAIVIDPKIVGKTNEDLRLALEAVNIESRPLWKPMHLQPLFASYPYYGAGVAENLYSDGLCLPSGSNLNEGDDERIAESLKLFFGV